MPWFLAAIDAQAYADGKPGEPDLSEFERDVLTGNIERYQQARIKRMSIVDLLNKMATGLPDPNSPRVDMSGMPDRELVEASLDGPYVDSATLELVKRANAKCITVVDFVRAAVSKGRY